MSAKGAGQRSTKGGYWWRVQGGQCLQKKFLKRWFFVYICVYGINYVLMWGGLIPFFRIPFKERNIVFLWWRNFKNFRNVILQQRTYFFHIILTSITLSNWITIWCTTASIFGVVSSIRRFLSHFSVAVHQKTIKFVKYRPISHFQCCREILV